MDSLIKVLADSGNLAVVVLTVANLGLLWLVKSLMTDAREQAREATAMYLKVAEALAVLRTEVQRCTNR